MVAGAMSMATGEYVSVSSQADTEKAALKEESTELKTDYVSEKKELALIYVRRGLDRNLADQVAEELMKHDALGAHAKDELGISETMTANPLQAATASACSFASGAALPLAIVAFIPHTQIVVALACGALISLALLGGIAAKIGGAPILPGVLRVLLWSALAMAITYAAGNLFGAK
jgi:VIT1/CCC1 family predicted Fe2+/Mn2+ transporter